MSSHTVYMKALQLQGLNKLVEVNLPVPVPGPGEVLIRTGAATICTSDLHDIKSNPFGIVYPRVLGHEGAGTVVACGEQVKTIAVGDRVATHPVVSCGTCLECTRGYAHLCTQMGHLGLDRDGCFAEYYVQRADRVRVLPETVSFAAGALLEPVAVCMQGVARAGNLKGKEVLIVGDGPFANIIARLCLAGGAGRLMVSGRSPFRLSRMPAVEKPDLLPEKSVDISILAVGNAEAAATCLKALRPRGRMVVFSAVHEPVPVDLFQLHVLEQEIVGACNDEDRLQDAQEFISENSAAMEQLVTHRLPFKDWEKAVDLARNGHDQALKVAIEF